MKYYCSSHIYRCVQVADSAVDKNKIDEKSVILQ